MKTRLMVGVLMVWCIAGFGAQSITNVNSGAAANDGTGDSVRAAFIKINTNFAMVDANITNHVARGTNDLWAVIAVRLTEGTNHTYGTSNVLAQARLDSTNAIWAAVLARLTEGTNHTYGTSNVLAQARLDSTNDLNTVLRAQLKGRSQIMGFNLTPALNTTTRYYAITAGPTGGGTTEGVYAVPTVSGTLTNLLVKLYNIGANTNVTFTVMVNGSASALTVSAVGNAGVVKASDTTHGVTVANGDTLSMRIAGNNTTASAANITVSWAMELVR